MKRTFVVADHRQVAWDETVHRGGESFTVDVVGGLEAQAKVWLTNGWVTEVTEPKPPAKKSKARRSTSVKDLEVHG